MQAASKSGTVIKILVRLGEQLSKKELADLTEVIINSVNALLNSYGGILELIYKTKPTKKELDNFCRMIDQKISGFVDIETRTNKIVCEMSPSTQEIVYRVIQMEFGLYTLNYGLFLPTKYQVNAVPPTVSLESVRRILEKPKGQNETKLNSYLRDFVFNQNADVDEDVNVQCKLLKSEGSKRVSLADRMTNKANKLTCYVSAFANHIGGHIYYGIDDDRVVKGQIVEGADEMKRITGKVEKTINKMIWPKRCGERKRGKEWDIFFEAVKEAIPSTYVIVIAVARCPGGVFAEEPKSYFISVDGKVVRMDFSSWTQRCLAGISGGQLEAVPSHVQRVPWSSPKNRIVFQRIKSTLVQYRNDNMMDRFETFCRRVVEMYPAIASLVVAGEEVAVALKTGQLENFEGLLGGFTKLIASTNDVLVFEGLELYLRSSHERGKGEYEKSYKTAQLGLQKMEQITPGVMSVWFYWHANAMATIMASQDGPDSERYMKEAQKWQEMAMRDVDMLEGEMVIDLKQKSHIYMAFSHLGMTLTGQTVKGKSLTSAEIDLAESEVKAVETSVSNGYGLSRFRESQLNLVKCELYFRKAECSSQNKASREFLKLAFQHGEKEEQLAKENHFKEEARYVRNRLARLRDVASSFPKHDCEDEIEDLERSIEQMNSTLEK